MESFLTVMLIPPLVDKSKAGAGPAVFATGMVRVDGVERVIVSDEADPLELGLWYISISNLNTL